MNKDIGTRSPLLIIVSTRSPTISDSNAVVRY